MILRYVVQQSGRLVLDHDDHEINTNKTQSAESSRKIHIESEVQVDEKSYS